MTNSLHIAAQQVAKEPNFDLPLCKSFWPKHATNVNDQTTCFPDMASCDVFLFPKFKEPLLETCFESTEDIKIIRLV